MMKKSKRISIASSIDESDIEKLNLLCSSKEVSRSSLVRDIIKYYLENIENIESIKTTKNIYNDIEINKTKNQSKDENDKSFDDKIIQLGE